MQNPILVHSKNHKISLSHGKDSNNFRNSLQFKKKNTFFTSIKLKFTLTSKESSHKHMIKVSKNTPHLLFLHFHNDFRYNPKEKHHKTQQNVKISPSFTFFRIIIWLHKKYTLILHSITFLCIINCLKRERFYGKKIINVVHCCTPICMGR